MPIAIGATVSTIVFMVVVEHGIAIVSKALRMVVTKGMFEASIVMVGRAARQARPTTKHADGRIAYVIVNV